MTSAAAVAGLGVPPTTETWFGAITRTRWALTGAAGPEQLTSLVSGVAWTGEQDGSTVRYWRDDDFPSSSPAPLEPPAACLQQLRELAVDRPQIRTLAVVQESRLVSIRLASGEWRQDTEQFAQATMIWQPPGALGTHGRRLRHLRTSAAVLDKATQEWSAIDFDEPLAEHLDEHDSGQRLTTLLAEGRTRFSPYATAQLLDRLVPYFFDEGTAGRRPGLPIGGDVPSAAGIVRVDDLTEYGLGVSRTIDDLGAALLPLTIYADGQVRQPLGIERGRAFRNSHRELPTAAPAGLRISSGTAAVTDADGDTAHIHKLQQLRTGGSLQSGQLRFVVCATIGDGPLIRMPVSTTANRFLGGIVAAGHGTEPMPTANRVLGNVLELTGGTLDAAA